MHRFSLLLLLGLTAALHAAPPPRLQSTVKGLLVVEHQNGNMAGTASQMNATAVLSEEPALTVGFNQDVGAQMKTATAEVLKFIHVRHQGRVPEGYRIELAFAEKYGPKDGPSAAVASALLIDSILTDNELDPAFAVTGDMNADGAVQPVGGIRPKIKGASRKGCTVVAIPQKNENAVIDDYIIEGTQTLAGIQIFSISTFEEARAIGSRQRSEELARAIEEFALVQKAVQRNGQFLFHAKVQEKLREILQLAPNHLSAKYLLLHGLKRSPKNLSLLGSITAIDTADVAFAQMINDGSYMESGSNDVLYKFVRDLERLRPQLDKRTMEYCDSYLGLASYIRENREKRIFTQQMQRELRAKAARVRNQRQTLISDPEVSAELMDQE